MIFRTILFSLSAFLSVMVCCTKAPAIKLDYSIADSFYCFKEKMNERIRGFGQISVSVDGRRYNGSIDIDYKNDLFKASAYSPFGALVASIDADSVQGEINDGKNSNRFFLDAIADSLVFISADDLTFRDFICILTGRLPQKFNRMGKVPPDTILREKRNSSLIWKQDSLEITARVHNKSSQLTRLTVRNTGNRGWRLLFEGINEQLAQSIELKVDDRNYFSIHYQRLKREVLKSS